MLEQKVTDKVKSLIAKDELAKALAILMESYSDNEQLDQLILQSGQLAALKKDQRKGIVDYNEQLKYFNQFRANLLGFVNTTPISLANESAVNPKTLKADYQKAKARMQVLQVLIGLTEGQSISAIYQTAKIKQRKLVVACLHELKEVEYVEKEKMEGMVYWKLTEAGKKFVQSLSL